MNGIFRFKNRLYFLIALVGLLSCLFFIFEGSDLYKKALSGDYNAEQQYQLGNAYWYGDNVHQNIDLAFDLYLKAANSGHDGAAYKLGLLYKHPNYRFLDINKAKFWLKKASSSGIGGATFALADISSEVKNNDGTLKAESLELYQTSLNQGYTWSAYILAKYYLELGDENSLFTAEKLLLNYPDKTHAAAIFLLGRLYIENPVLFNRSLGGWKLMILAGYMHSSEAKLYLEQHSDNDVLNSLLK